MSWCTRSLKLREQLQSEGNSCKVEGAVAKLTEQLASSKAWVAKLEGLVEEQRRTLEDFKDQMSILVSKLLERDSNVK